MGIKYCCVPTCRHELVNCLGRRTIPNKDVVIRDAWLEMLGLTPESFRSYMRVCNCHFHCCDAQPPQPHYCFPTHHKRDLPPAAGIKFGKKAELGRRVGDVLISPHQKNGVAPSRETEIRLSLEGVLMLSSAISCIFGGFEVQWFLPGIVTEEFFRLFSAHSRKYPNLLLLIGRRVNGFVDWYQTEVAANQVQLDDEGGNWEVTEAEEKKPSVRDSDSEWLFSTFDPAVDGELVAGGLSSSSKGDEVKPEEEFVDGDYNMQTTLLPEWSYYEMAKDWYLHLESKAVVELPPGAVNGEDGSTRSSNVGSLVDGVSEERRCGFLRGDSSRKKSSPKTKDSNPVMDVDDPNNVVVDLDAMNSLLTDSDSDEDSTVIESSKGVRNVQDPESSSPRLVLMSKDDLIKRLFAGLVQMKAKNKKARRRKKELDEEIKQLREELAKRSDFIIS